MLYPLQLVVSNRKSHDQQKDEPMIGVEPTATSDGATVSKMPPSPPIGSCAWYITIIPPKRLMTWLDGGTDIHDAAKALVHFLEPTLQDDSNLHLYAPVIILAFDEAHQLTDVQVGSADKPWSRFSELRRNIRKLRFFPIFSLFISTVSKIADLTPTPKEDMSMRIMNETLTLLPPFTELGFDQIHISHR